MKLRDQNVEKVTMLLPPSVYAKQFPVTPKLRGRILDWRQQIRDIISGSDQRLLVIMGPCSIHDERAALEYAGHVAKLNEKFNTSMLLVARMYFEKSRTIGGWPGLLYDPRLDGSFQGEKGLTLARYILLRVAQIGVPAATEWMDPIVPQYLADLVSWGAMGARTVEHPTLRSVMSAGSMTIGFKNGTEGTLHSIKVAVNAILAAKESRPLFGIDYEKGRAAFVRSKGGKQDCHLVLRGGECGPNYDSRSIATACAILEKAGLPQKLLVDCSHGNSGGNYTQQSSVFRNILKQRVESCNSPIVGMMLESHLYEGKQPLNGDPRSLRYGVSVTDSCIGLPETKELLQEAYEAPNAERR